MAKEKRTVTKAVDVSNKKHDRSLHFSYADGGSEHPGDLTCTISIRAAGSASDTAVRSGGYLNKEEPRGLTEAELSQLNGLLDKLFDAAINDAAD